MKGYAWRTLIFIFGMVLRLLFLDGTVVIDEDESVVILWIGVSLGTLIARAQVTGRVESWQCSW